MSSLEGLCEEARQCLAEGRLEQARALCEAALALDAGAFMPRYLLGIVEYRRGEPLRAVELIEAALEVCPQHARAHLHLGNALAAAGRIEAALAAFERGRAFAPHDAEIELACAQALLQHGRFEAALPCFDRALTARSDWPEALAGKGLSCAQLGRYLQAIACFDAALELDPGQAHVLDWRGNARRVLRQLESALTDFDRAIALQPSLPEPHNNRGSTLAELDRLEEALASFDRAVAIVPDYAEARVNRGNVLKRLRRWSDALADYEAALHTRADLAEAYYNRGDLYRTLGDLERSISDLERACVLRPDLPFLRGLRLHVRMQLGDWRGFEAARREIAALISAGAPAAPPFAVLGMSDSPKLQYAAAAIWVRHQCPPAEGPPPSVGKGTSRIRLGYFSPDFRDHPVGHLIADLLARHDRDRFEIHGFSYSPPPGDPMRERLEGVFDHWHDVMHTPDRGVADLARRCDIDIAIDLAGYTDLGRPRIFAHRAAPLQLSWLGYLGTSAAPYIDYLVADPAIVSAAHREFVSERILYLKVHQPNGADTRPVIPPMPTRASLGLPAHGVVFCCFNASYKILPDTFDSWMRILAQVPASVLFLLAGPFESQLRDRAQAQGIAASRLVFGPRVARAQYLARLRAADLFLDTLPYNAGTTASDALWCGLPLLTLRGAALASRTASSLLSALGLSELITDSRAEYERRAIELGSDPGRLWALKARLTDARSSTLFDGAAFARDFETGLQLIHARQQAGLPPSDIATGALTRDATRPAGS